MLVFAAKHAKVLLSNLRRLAAVIRVFVERAAGAGFAWSFEEFGMAASQRSSTRAMTVKYLFALGVLAALAVVNYAILHRQIKQNESMAAIVSTSGRQRSLLQRTVLLAQELVSVVDPAARRKLRRDLLETTAPLEAAHFALVRPNPDVPDGPPPEVRDIYEKTPWLLDTEMRNYVVHVRLLAETPDNELSWGNSHFRYLSEAALSGAMLEGLDAVVAAYQKQSDAKVAALQRMALWSLYSTLGVLLLTGLFVFRPMAGRVRQDMDALTRFNETLERRVARRTAEAEQRAQDLAVSEAALRDQRRILQLILDSMGDGVIVADSQQRFLVFNPAARRILRISAHDPAPQRWSQRWLEGYGAAMLLPDGRTPFPSDQAPLWRAMRGEVVDRVEVALRLADITDLAWLNVTARPLLDEQGAVLGGVVVLRDDTQRRLAEQRMLQSERLAAVGQMVAGVAHESRNALQQIQACARMLEWEIEGNGEARGLFADLQKSQDRLHRLFEDLRGYVAPLALERRQQDLRAPLREAWDALAHLREGRDARVVEEPHKLDLRCSIDAFKIEQVFRNILENALLACQDPVVIQVRYTTAQIAGQPAVAVSIVDNGPGLNAEQREKLFDAFYTTRTQGAGLGMAIAKRIVDAHGGHIAVASGARGAEIVVTLPRGTR